jgi:hypothetical protein
MLRLSCPANAGHPVITAAVGGTGSPAVAGDDSIIWGGGYASQLPNRSPIRDLPVIHPGRTPSAAIPEG